MSALTVTVTWRKTPMFISSKSDNAFAVGMRERRFFDSPSGVEGSKSLRRRASFDSPNLRIRIIDLYLHRMQPAVTAVIRTLLICTAQHSCCDLRSNKSNTHHCPKANRSIFSEGRAAKRSERDGFRVINRTDLSRLRITARVCIHRDERGLAAASQRILRGEPLVSLVPFQLRFYLSRRYYVSRYCAN